ncbi:putative ionotropic glutamate receptor [Helianthus annuus]|nr:putative ionotropic glutamate receptor [Helianthus annuus]
MFFPTKISSSSVPILIYIQFKLPGALWLCNLSKFVLFVWLLVVLILISSYTATLSSLLTVEQFELASKGGTVGFHGGSFEAGLAGVTVSNLHFEDYRRKPFYL